MIKGSSRLYTLFPQQEASDKEKTPSAFCASGLITYNVFTFAVFRDVRKDSVAVTGDFAELVQSLVSDRNDAEIVLRNIISDQSIRSLSQIMLFIHDVGK